MGTQDGFGVYLTNEEFRGLLKDAYKIKRDAKCSNCNGTGYENWSANGDDIKPGRTSNPDRCDGLCEECNGLGYII